MAFWFFGFSFCLYATAQEAPLSTTQAVRAPLDATVFTTYSQSTDKTTIYWDVSGHTKLTYGSYGGGSLGPFGKIGGLIEGTPHEDLNTKTVTREIYVLDLAAGSQGTGVALSVYVKKDRMSASYDKVTAELAQVITLPLIGGSAASAFMAGNERFLYVGTNQGPDVVRIAKRNLAVVQVPYGVSPQVVTGITANSYGYVSLIYTYSFGILSETLVIGPDGTWVSANGGATFTLNPIQQTFPAWVQ